MDTHRFRSLRASAAGLSLAGAAAAQVEFEPPVIVEMSGSEPTSACLADFDNDDHVDVAASGAADEGNVTVLLGDGLGGFPNNENFSSFVAAWGIAAGDFNGDGNQDLAVTNGVHDAREVKVFLGDGSGKFTTPYTTLTAGKFPIAVVAVDLNHDSVLDLAVANNVLYGVTIFLGKGDGFFGPGQHVPGVAGIMATDLDTGHFNEDAHFDILVSHYDGVWMLAGDGAGGFTLTTYLPLPWSDDVVVADMTGDGMDDVVAIGENAIVAQGHEDATFDVLWTSPDLGYLRGRGDVADVNRDGRPDIVAMNTSGTGPRIFLNEGGGVYSSGTAYPVGVQPALVRSGDWNEDGWPDLIVVDRNFGDTMFASVLNQVPPASQPAELVDFHVAYGLHISGGLSDLRQSDDLSLRTRSKFGFTAFEPNVMDLVVGAVTALDQATWLDLSIESRINNPGGAARARLMNWSSGQYQQVHQFPVGTTESIETIADVGAGQRVRDADGRIELSLRYSVIATFSLAGFDAWFDAVEITVRQ
jgi:hypothetical protein